MSSVTCRPPAPASGQTNSLGWSAYELPPVIVYCPPGLTGWSNVLVLITLLDFYQQEDLRVTYADTEACTGLVNPMQRGGTVVNKKLSAAIIGMAITATACLSAHAQDLKAMLLKPAKGWVISWSNHDTRNSVVTEAMFLKRKQPQNAAYSIYFTRPATTS